MLIFILIVQLWDIKSLQYNNWEQVQVFELLALQIANISISNVNTGISCLSSIKTFD